MRGSGKVLLAAGVLAAGGALAAALSGGSRQSPVELTIWFTCDTNGRLEPCGCFSGQYGGLARFSTKLKTSYRPGDIIVDVGDAIAGAQDYHIIQYKYILQAAQRLKYDALNIGHREARLPLATLKELRASSPVPLISANLLEKETGTPIFPPYQQFERSGFSIVVVGVLDPVGLEDDLAEELTVKRMEVAIGNLLPRLKDKADILILLAFTDENRLRELAKEFYEFDLILGGRVAQPSQELARENRSIILYTTNESRAVGMLQARFESRNKLTPLGFNVHLMHEEIPEDPEILALAQAYRDEVRRTRLEIDDLERLREDQVPGVKETAVYVGSDSCRECHPTAYVKWKSSRHSRAFRSLQQRNSDADPNCIACHTVGFGSPSGYRRQYQAERLTNVGCESCHGPGGEHVRQRRAREKALFRFRPLGPGDCSRCHDGEFSRPFDWDKLWPFIVHGKEDEKP